jgi:hypothetical protein
LQEIIGAKPVRDVPSQRLLSIIINLDRVVNTQKSEGRTFPGDELVTPRCIIRSAPVSETGGPGAKPSGTANYRRSTKNQHFKHLSNFMTDILNKSIVLVLNLNWQAISIRTPQVAFCMMATNVATGLEIEGADNNRPVTWE